MNAVNILMYHQVGLFARPTHHRANFCHVERFRQHMKWLKRLRCHVIGMDVAAAGLRGERPLPPRAIVITFDDGYENFHEFALPALREHQFPALVYVVSGLLGKTAAWLDPTGLPPAPLMSAARIRDLRRAGIQIGSHTVTHPRLDQLSTPAARRELADSKSALEDVLGEQVNHLCYPYGSHDLEIMRAAAEIGYLTGTTCVRAAARPGDDLLALPRQAIHYGDGPFRFVRRILLDHRPQGIKLKR